MKIEGDVERRRSEKEENGEGDEGKMKEEGDGKQKFQTA